MATGVSPAHRRDLWDHCALHLKLTLHSVSTLPQLKKIVLHMRQLPPAPRGDTSVGSAPVRAPHCCVFEAPGPLSLHSSSPLVFLSSADSVPETALAPALGPEFCFLTTMPLGISSLAEASICSGPTILIQDFSGTRGKVPSLGGKIWLPLPVFYKESRNSEHELFTLTNSARFFKPLQRADCSTFGPLPQHRACFQVALGFHPRTTRL